MNNRRSFLRMIGAGLAATALTLIGAAGSIWAAAKKYVLPRNTKSTELIHQNPAELDPRLLDDTPIEDFRTMGQTQFDFDLETWRLDVAGELEKPLSLSYQDILNMPSVEKKVLLICPGFFSYVATWKGFPLIQLLRECGLKPGSTKVKAYGPRRGKSAKEEIFTMEEINMEKIFIAYGVNGLTLPERHGFPVRIVAEDRYGDDWIKYLSRIIVV